ncbi:MAG: hypothetical protein ACYCYK_03505 [Candidatus Dormibacteria bacterium]
MAAALLLGGSLMTACAVPTAAPRAALQDFLVDVHAHSVVYAYTLLTNTAEARTPFIPFFNWVKSNRADFKIVSIRMVNAADAEATVAISSPGRPTADIQVQMVESGNAGDWLVNAPFATEGASAVHHFE